MGWMMVLWLQHRDVGPETIRIDALLSEQSAAQRLPMIDGQAIHLHRSIVLDELPTERALMIGYARQATIVEINGVQLEHLALRQGEDQVGLKQSFLYFVPKDLLHVGGNALEIDFAVPPGTPVSLSEISLDRRDRLEHRFRKLNSLRSTLPQIAGITAALVALFAAMLWLARPHETLYGWFALGTILWMIYLFNFIWYRAPFVGERWMAVIHVALAFSLLCFKRFCILFMQRQVPGLERALDRVAIAAALATLAVALIAPNSSALYTALHIVLRLILLALGVAIICGLLWSNSALPDQQRERAWLAASSTLGLSLGIWDSAIVLGRLPIDTPYVFHLGIFPLVLVFGYILMRRFTGLLDQAQAQNAVLDLRVQDNAKQLELAFAERQRFEREKLLADERHRLATDLHDGAGSQLVSLLSAVRRDGMDRQQMEQALSDAIADLRLVMDSIDSLGSDLAEALGQFRSRMEPKLTASGVKSKWRTASLSEGLRLSPRRTLSVFRALQECLVNVLKHASATEVEISAQELGNVLSITVRDNGLGLPVGVDRNKGSRGLANLEYRMKSLGGYAKFQPANTSDSTAQAGLEVALYVPIPTASETQW
jgi:signal transduction histidine kinase